MKVTLSLTTEGRGWMLQCDLPLLPHAVEEPGVTIVPQPDLSGATEQMSADEVQLRLLRKAEELKGDSSLTEVRLGRLRQWVAAPLLELKRIASTMYEA